MASDYLEGGLDPVDRRAVEEHLAHCEHCTGYLEQVLRMLELTREEPPGEVPGHLLESLTREFRRRRDERGRG